MAKCKRKQRLLGKSIRRIRMRRNMTQRELANAIEGTGESALRSYELGERSPKCRMLWSNGRNNMENTRLAKSRLRNIKTGKGNIRQTNRRMNQGQMIPF